MTDDAQPPQDIRQNVSTTGGSSSLVAGRDATQHITTAYTGPPPPTPTALRSLPRDVDDFTGRDHQLQHLLAAAGPHRVLSVHTVDGMPGVGKTALVTHLAHRLAPHYPDAQFFEPLHAHTPGQAPAKPVDVLGDLLTRLGTTAQHLPPTLEGRQALWRDRTADQRLLLFLDDALDHAQVQPLLPSGPGCLTLITSRRRLIALNGALALPLDTLPSDEAGALFLRIARHTSQPADTAPLARIVELCSGLPLALVILAGRLARHPAWTLHWLADTFAATQHRLDELSAGDHPGDLAVRTAFAMSYRDLPAQRQRVFRSMGLHPGPDTDAYATAALTAIPLHQARHQLEELYTDHLLDETTPGRYHPHDLLRTYAHTLTTEHDAAEDRERAVERLWDYYQRTAQSADRHLTRTHHPDPPPPAAPAAPEAAAPPLADRAGALSWMHAERANLLACLDTATTDQATRMIDLTASMAAFLYQEGLWTQAATLHQRAATAAHDNANLSAEAAALDELGCVRLMTGEYAQAAGFHERALALYEDLDNRLGQAAALDGLGCVRLMTGEYAQAAGFQKRALALYEDLDNRLGQANALHELGSVRLMTGPYVQAAGFHERALALYEDLDNRLGQANALYGLGCVRQATGEYAQAAGFHERALALCEDLDSRFGQANALYGLGCARLMTGEYAQAAGFQKRALALYEDLGDRLGQTGALYRLGCVRQATGEYAQAAGFHERALALCEDLGDRQAQAEVLNSMGALLAESAGPQRALASYQQALKLARQIQSPLDEARALDGVAHCLVRVGDSQAALAALRQAVGIYRRIGAAEAKSAAARLSALKAEDVGAPSSAEESTD
ncbi:tetratricopeptide repeat protein [Streptomyces sp. NBC_01518]|uniref:tetratricopeptide repeat protein n=1 Tax=Streptomyces sp. NBC_01518 TaxID=2903891 RepID=UPI00386DD128